MPGKGVPSKTPTIEELQANIDEPKPENWKPEEIQQEIKQWNRP